MNYSRTVGGLFSGVGGIELGFERGGFEVLWANECDAKACETYRSIHDHRLIEDDIHNLKGEELPAPDVLTAGFPCQAFSIAGYRKGFSDKRGNLFYQIMRLVDELPEKPKVLFLENVKNFHTHDSGNTIKVVREEIEARGYSVMHQVLNTADYTDIPQNRERIFLVCFRDEKDWEFNPDSSCSRVFDRYFPPKRIHKSKDIADMLDCGKVDSKYYYGESKPMYEDLNKAMKRRDTVYQWRRTYVRENQSGRCPTLTANMGTGGHNVPLIVDDYGFRKLTPAECFRFQGFGDLPRYIPVSDSSLYKQAGNSVTVTLVERLALLIYYSMGKREYYEQENQVS